MNAAGSAEGREFAVRNADYLLCVSVDLEKSKQEVDAIVAKSAAVGRQIGVITLAHVVCRPSKKEAWELLHYYADFHADWAAVDNLMALQGLHAKSFPQEA